MHYKRKFEQREFAILAEFEPPKGVDLSAMVANARKVKGKVDAFMVPEMSNAVMRMSSLGGAMVLQNAGMDAVMQVNCRDRNRIALQADLLAASACGIQGVMTVQGEDPSFGDHHQARAVNDIDQFELLEAISKLQQGKDMAGIDLQGSPEFVVGSTSNAGAKGKSPELELEELKKKHEAGVTFFITPPIFDLDLLDAFMKKVELERVAIIPTIMLLKSLGMARYIERNLNHVFIPPSIIERLQKAPDKVRECIQIAADLINQCNQAGYSGVLLATIGWEDRLPDILEKVKR
jgi:5,10-methylenetetrahydrofolate reductase